MCVCVVEQLNAIVILVNVAKYKMDAVGVDTMCGCYSNYLKLISGVIIVKIFAF